MGDKFFADVAYQGSIYFDAELIRGSWCFETADGNANPFKGQEEVRLVTELSQRPRHAGCVFAFAED